ncbi:MAG: NUDIX hydrolase [Chloroflexi bacterium]|nr:NUDIX hydrolase [Chloroflexota bacterium]
MKPERLARTTVYESPWVNLYLDRVKFPNGRIIDQFHLLDFPREAALAILENAAGEVAFVRVPRYTTGRAEWELPAGGIENGESPLDAAKREAREETGFDSAAHRLLYSYHPMNGNARQRFHIVACQAGEHIQGHDVDEVSEVRWFTRAGILQMIRDKSLTDGYSLTALLLWLQGEDDTSGQRE